MNNNAKLYLSLIIKSLAWIVTIKDYVNLTLCEVKKPNCGDPHAEFFNVKYKTIIC